jgi:hypothetical protein
VNLTVITTYTFGLGTQAWAGRSEPDFRRSLRPSESLGPRSKPQDDFFTSTWDSSSRSSAWLDFMRSRGQRTPEGRRVWLLVPEPSATLCVIDSLVDYETLANNLSTTMESPYCEPEESHPRSQLESDRRA